MCYDSTSICCPCCRAYLVLYHFSSDVRLPVDLLSRLSNVCCFLCWLLLYIFSVLTRIKLVAFSNLLNLSHGKVKQMGTSVSTQFCPSHFILVLTQFLFIIIIFFFLLLPFLLLLFYYYLFITQKYRKWV